MSVVSIPIVNKNYPMGCEDGQEGRLIELGKMVDAAHAKFWIKSGLCLKIRYLRHFVSYWRTKYAVAPLRR